MQAVVQKLKGKLGRQTYILEPHVCVVDMPPRPKGLVHVLFIGEKDRKVETAQITVDTDNDSAKFAFSEVLPGVALPAEALGR